MTGIDMSSCTTTPSGEMQRVRAVYEELYAATDHGGRTDSPQLVDLLAARYGVYAGASLHELGAGRGYVAERALDLGMKVIATDNVDCLRPDIRARCSAVYELDAMRWGELPPCHYAVCAGMLPYVPEVYVADVLRMIAGITQYAVAFDIHMRMSTVRPNMELTLQGPAWWLEVLQYVGFTNIARIETKSGGQARHQWLTVLADSPS